MWDFHLKMNFLVINYPGLNVSGQWWKLKIRHSSYTRRIFRLIKDYVRILDHIVLWTVIEKEMKQLLSTHYPWPVTTQNELEYDLHRWFLNTRPWSKVNIVNNHKINDALPAQCTVRLMWNRMILKITLATIQTVIVTCFYLVLYNLNRQAFFDEGKLLF